LDFKPDNNEAYLYNYLRVLDSQAQLSKGTTVQIANKLFAAEDLTIKPNFKKAMETFYNSDIQNVNFKNAKETVDIINNFVSNKTKGLIDELFN
jgi:serpin B